MNSLWKDLLFLHGHLVRKEDLAWRPDTHTGADRNSRDAWKKVNSVVVQCCALIWPRLAGPR